MKKLCLLFLCAALVLQAAAPWYTPAAAKAYGTGISLRLDVDSSGTVDFKDCALAAQLAAGWSLNTALRERADVNGDDLVDLKDVTVLAGLVVGSPRWANHAENNTAYDWPKLEPGTARAGTVISGSEKPEKAKGTLQSFTLLTQNNNELGFNLACGISGGEVTALLPAGTNLASLVPSFESTKPLYYGGRRLYSGFSTVDFTRPVVLRVGSPNSSEQYELYLKTFNTGLPSFCITTESYEPINSKVERKNCTVFAGGGNREKNGEYAFETNQTVQQTGTVKNRGWTSFYIYPKKSYTLKLDKKEDFLGLGKNKEWALVANFPDRSLVRNAAANRLAHAVQMETVMDLRFVDLWVNGTYQGNYQLIEKIEVGKNRVNITDFDASILPENMGYIVETNGHNKAEEFGTFTGGQDADRPKSWQKINSYATYDPFSGDIFFNSKHFSSIFNVNKPSDKKLMALSAAQRNAYLDYIYSYMDQTEAAIASGSYRNAAAYLDMDAMARWYIVEELSMNTDSRLHCSCYMYKDAGTKLKMGPVWDFDMGFGNGKYANENHVKQPYLDGATWFAKLTNMPEFRAAVKQIWQQNYAEISALNSYITKTAQMLNTSQAYNFKLWGINDYAEHAYARSTQGISTYSGQIDYLTGIVSARMVYMQNKLAGW